MHESGRSDVAGQRWDPGQYLKYDRQRLRPALDLLGQIQLDGPQTVFDLGCGAGNVTRVLAARWPQSSVGGVDVSEQMLERARATASAIDWIQADIKAWQPAAGPADVLFSNATLQWLDAHDRLLPRLVSMLGSGGCLAVQMPVSYQNESHRLMREIYSELEAAHLLGDEQAKAPLKSALMRNNVLSTAQYYDLLRPHADSLDIWQTEYLQQLEGPEAVFEWVKATALRPVLNGLKGDALSEFLQRYRARLLKAYPPREDGVTLYPFLRMFLVLRVP